VERTCTNYKIVDVMLNCRTLLKTEMQNNMFGRIVKHCLVGKYNTMVVNVRLAFKGLEHYDWLFYIDNLWFL